MHRRGGLAVLLGALAVACLLPRGLPERFAYPDAPRGDVVDDHHGTRVADPYRWLEDADAPATRAWVEAQNALTESILSRIPQREPIRERLTALWDFERYGLPEREGGRYFYTRNDGLQDHAVLYVADALDAEPRALLNPNVLSADGTVALAGWAPSPDGRLLAYGVSESGSDWRRWHVRDVATGRDLDDRIDWVKFSRAAWTRDSSGFFYSRYEAPPAGGKLQAEHGSHRVYFHRVGDPQSKDRLVHTAAADDAQRWLFGGFVSHDDRYALIWSRPEGTQNNGLLYRDRAEPGSDYVPLLAEHDARYAFVGNDGPVFWVRTDLDAPNGRLVAIDTRRPAREHWRDLIPETQHALGAVSHVGGRLIATYLADARSLVRVHRTDGRLERDFDLPGPGTAGGFGGEPDASETFFVYTSHTRPSTIYRHDLDTARSEVFRAPDVDFDPDALEARQVFYESRDGTRVPMFLVHRKGLQPDGATPTLLHGYGGFNISMVPRFSIGFTVFAEMGGIVALPNLRGGGEYGEAWHRAGMKQDKQNVFDDFIAAGEWLIASGYTSPERLAIAGRSNGGLLVGAVMTQRPELFAAALPGVGVLDMLRFHRFTIGWAWTAEYGSPDDPNDFPYLYAYSPLHNLRSGVRYPATLAHTSDHDDRVVPAHSYKFIAALQAVQPPDVPALIRVEVKSGHGGGKPTARRIEEVADLWSFLAWRLGMEAPRGLR